MSAPAQKPERGRVDALDAVRGVALSMVLATHCFYMTPDGSSFTEALRAVIRSTWLSVHMFFVLSGFLITGILIRARGTQNYFRDFYIRRALRILPAYYLLLAFIFFVYPLFNAELRDSGLPKDWASLVFYVQNLHASYVGPYAWHGVGHFWSLAVEEQFYLLWPVFILLLPPRLLPWFCAAIFCFSGGLRAYWIATDASYLKIFVHTLTNMDGLAAGAWVAAVTANTPNPDQRRIRNVSITGALALACLAVMFLHYRGLDFRKGFLLESAIPLWTVGIAVLIYRIHHGVMTWPERYVFSRPAFVWIGRYSYGIYLIHGVMLAQIFLWVQHGWPAVDALSKNLKTVIGGVLILALTFPLARLMFAWVEAPALRLARRLTPSHHNPAAEHPAINR